MLGQQFYHETIRRMVVTFGTIFNNINLVRKDNNGNIIQKMKVPLAYGPKRKFLVRLDQDANLDSTEALRYSNSALCHAKAQITRTCRIRTCTLLALAFLFFNLELSLFCDQF